MITILSNNRITKSEAAHVIDDDLWLPVADYAALPLANANTATAHDDRVNVSAHSRQLERPVVHDESATVWAIGASAAERGAALQSLQAPDFTLADLDGTPHSLTDYRGSKIFLASWASW